MFHDMTTQLGPFELREPLPAVRSPRALLALRPWIDVGSVGTMTLAFLQEAWDAEPIAQLSRPGRFYDFTRYRPMLYRDEGQRQVSLPNTSVYHAGGEGESDWVLVHALEPHSNGEEYVEGLLQLLQRLSVTQYCLIGSMYAPVPHTRRPVASGSASNEAFTERLRQIGVRESTYEGPTTVLAMLSAMTAESGIESAGMILQLPAYAQVERDYRGLQAMLALVSALYGLDLDMEALQEEGARQAAAIDASVQEDPRLQTWLKDLEAAYDSESGPQGPGEEEGPDLSPELERFLRDVERRWQEGEG
jgi:predicted ATP-grasp superfamily ATP-dependent carboligase